MHKKIFIMLSVVMVLTFGGIGFQSAIACPARTHIPKPDEPERYSQIFYAQVKAIEPLPDRLLSYSDLTPPFKLTLVEPVTLIGEKFLGTSIVVGPGCGWPFPKVGVTAMFFVEKGYRLIIPAYDESDSGALLPVIESLKRSGDIK